MDSRFRHPAWAACALGLALSGLLFGCRGKKATADKAPDVASPTLVDQATVLATVNGKPITELDVQYWLAKNSRGRDVAGTAQEVKNVLEVIIAQELIFQKAVELGLDKTPDYQRKVQAKQAEVASFLRTEMRTEYFSHKASEAEEAAKTEAKSFFEKHADKIRTRYHLHQILRKSEAEIDAVARELAGGTSFEQATGLATADLPATAPKPWDMGHLNWVQVPEAWRAALDELEVGATSGIIRAPGDKRFWIIRLVGKERDPTVTFESVQAALVTAIQREKVEAVRANLDRELREKATIVYVREPKAITAEDE